MCFRAPLALAVWVLGLSHDLLRPLPLSLVDGSTSVRVCLGFGDAPFGCVLRRGAYLVVVRDQRLAAASSQIAARPQGLAHVRSPRPGVRELGP